MSEFEKTLFIIRNEGYSTEFISLHTGWNADKIHRVYRQLFETGKYGLYKELAGGKEPKIRVKRDVFRERFCRIAKERGKSFNQYAMRIGTSCRNLCNYRDGHTAPRTELLLKIADHFGVEPLWLAGY